MIVDLAQERFPTPIRKHLCVVGTGIGGGSFLSRYPEHRGDLVVVEAGGHLPSRAVEFESVGHPLGLEITREVSLGGTSNVWRGLSTPLDAIDFLPRPDSPVSGWPLDRSTLDPYYREAGRLLDLAAVDYFTDWCSRPELRRMADAINFDRTRLAPKCFLYTRPPKSFRDDVRRRCSGPNDLLLLNAVAVEFVPSPSGQSVDKLLVRHPAGQSLEIQADHFVIAAGALETPRLLLNSRRRHAHGIGNDHDLVGRFLMDHPMGSLSQIQLRKLTNAPLYQSVKLAPRHFIKTGFVPAAERQSREHLLNHCCYLWPSFHRGIDPRFEALRRSLISARGKRLRPGDFLTLLTNLNTAYRVLSFVLPIGALYRYADLFFVTEQTPDRQSRVTLSDKKDRFGYPIARVNWTLPTDDLRSIAAFNNLALEALSPSISGVTCRMDQPQMSQCLTSAAHHMGTARMSPHERTGVVDPNLRVWQMHNLHICDASVFPTSGNANPGFTICALAIRLADHLARMP